VENIEPLGNIRVVKGQVPADRRNLTGPTRISPRVGDQSAHRGLPTGVAPRGPASGAAQAQAASCGYSSGSGAAADRGSGRDWTPQGAEVLDLERPVVTHRGVGDAPGQRANITNTEYGPVAPLSTSKAHQTPVTSDTS
jgi:hypothetical protein